MNPGQNERFTVPETPAIDAEALLMQADKERKEVVERYENILQDIMKSGGMPYIDPSTERGKKFKAASGELMMAQMNYEDAKDFKIMRDEGKTDKEIADYFAAKWNKLAKEFSKEE